MQPVSPGSLLAPPVPRKLLQLLDLGYRAKHCLILQPHDVPQPCLPVGLDNSTSETGPLSPHFPSAQYHTGRQLVQMAGHPRGKRSLPLSLVLGKHPTRGWGWGLGVVVVVVVGPSGAKMIQGMVLSFIVS